MKTTLQNTQTLAMKAKLKATTDEEIAQAEINLSVIRALVAAVSEAETSGKVRKELSNDEVINVLKKEYNKRMASAVIYREAEALDRAEREAAEALIVKEFLPKETSNDEIEAFVKSFVKANGLAGAGGKAMGQVMSALKSEFENFDSRNASAIVKELIF